MNTPLLIVSATGMEIKTILSLLNMEDSDVPSFQKTTYRDTEIHVLITGIGILPMTHHLTLALSKTNYRCVVNAGIAGAVNPSLENGDVVLVTHDCLPELALDTPAGLQPLSLPKNISPVAISMFFEALHTVDSEILSSLPQVTGITVQTVTGTTKRLDFMRKTFNPGTESMEGAAFLYVCNALGQPCAQVRSISNPAGCANKDQWNMEKAVKSLHNVLIAFLEEQGGL